MKRTNRSILLFVIAGLLPALAVAHPGHGTESGFPSGFAHPFGGADHVAVLFAAGFIAWQLGRRAGAMLVTGLLTLFVAAHRDWIAPGAEGWGFVAGFVLAGVMLIGFGNAAARLVRRLSSARTRRARETPAATSRLH